MSGAAGAERRPLPAGCLGRGATARALPVPQRSGLGSAGSPRAPGGRSSGPGSRPRLRPGPRPRRRRHGDGPAPAGSARAARTGSRYRFRGHRRRHGGRHAGECGAVAPRRWRRGGFRRGPPPVPAIAALPRPVCGAWPCARGRTGTWQPFPGWEGRAGAARWSRLQGGRTGAVPRPAGRGKGRPAVGLFPALRRPGSRG